MERIKKQDLWFAAGLFGIGLILFWRCFYSVNTTDEAYYIGTVFRLWQGDGMLCDEWNPTQQLCSFWLYPFYALFRVILGSNDGMILAFRLLYIVFQLAVSAYLYQKLKRFSSWSALPVFFYLLSTAFNINSLSYNTMANSCLLALLVTLTVMKGKNTKDCVLSGVFASVVVMANPYMVFAYLLYAAACIAVTLICKKNRRQIPVCLQFRTVFQMSLTALAVLIVFLLFTLRNASAEEVIKNLPYIIGDEEHYQRWSVKFGDYFRYFDKHYLYCAAGTLLVSAAAMFDKKRSEHSGYYLLAAAVCTLPYIIYHGWISDYVPINLVTVPICFLGLPVYIVSKKKESAVFYTWYLPSMIYPFVVQISSNTGILAVSSAFVTAGCASVLLIVLWVRRTFHYSGKLKKAAGILLGLIVLLQLAAMLFLRITYVWADAPLSELDTKVERGPAKGLYTSESTVHYYNELFDDIDSLNMRAEDGFLVIGSEPMLYLYADREVASYSTWRVYTNETRLYRYYEIHNGEGKFPEVVYCVEADDTIYDSILVEKLLLPSGYESEKLPHGIAFYTKR